MVSNIEVFELSREELTARLKWYENRYGPYITSRGIHNWKNLFRKPNYYEWIILVMLMMSLFIAWAYQHDISACREYMAQETIIIKPTNLSLPLTLPLNLTLKKDGERTNQQNNIS